MDGVTIKIGTMIEVDVRGTKVSLALIGAVMVFSGVSLDAVYAAIGSLI